MSIIAADPATALAGYLLSELSDQVGGRVYSPELPREQVGSEPRACLVVRRDGGYTLFGGSNPPIGDPRLNIYCYGGTWYESENLAGAVVPTLRRLRSSLWPQPDPTARLMWARITTGPLPVADPETEWPCTVVSAQVAHCELSPS